MLVGLGTQTSPQTSVDGSTHYRIKVGKTIVPMYVCRRHTCHIYGKCNSMNMVWFTSNHQANEENALLPTKNKLLVCVCQIMKTTMRRHLISYQTMSIVVERVMRGVWAGQQGDSGTNDRDYYHLLSKLSNRATKVK